MRRFLLSVLLIGIGHAFIPEVDNDTCVNLFVCTLRSPTNFYEFDHDKNFLLEVDTNGCNIAEAQRNRSTITNFVDYECATIKNLQERDAGVYELHIAKEDGIRHLKKTFRLTTDDLNNLRNVSHLNTNGSNSFHGLPILTYPSTPETELPEALRLISGNGTKPDFILAVLVTSQNPATKESMNVTSPTGLCFSFAVSSFQPLTSLFFALLPSTQQYKRNSSSTKRWTSCYPNCHSCRCVCSFWNCCHYCHRHAEEKSICWKFSQWTNHFCCHQT